MAVLPAFHTKACPSDWTSQLRLLIHRLRYFELSPAPVARRIIIGFH